MSIEDAGDRKRLRVLIEAVKRLNGNEMNNKNRKESLNITIVFYATVRKTIVSFISDL
jgi:hypothetical protein